MLRSLPMATLGPLLAIGVAACAGPSSQDDAIRTIRIYDLLRAFPRAKREAYPGYASSGAFSVNEQVRPGLFLHPSGAVVFPPVRVSAESVLSFRIGMIDDAWEKEGDGVEFSVFVQRMSNASTKIFSRYIDPKHRTDDRRWFEEKVRLRQFGDQEIRIMLATGPGPANDFSYDWAVFGEPQIMLDPSN